MKQAFEGPNGWYVSEENAQGFHCQPESGGTLTESQARREAGRVDDYPDERDLHGHYDDDPVEMP